MKKSIFQLGKFKAASGNILPWKIECDNLTDDDLDCLAHIAVDIAGPFKSVWGVPRGGVRFAEHLKKFEDPNAKDLLLVDDVITTGCSISRFIAETMSPDKILVIFDRRPLYHEYLYNVKCIFRIYR
jgi:hypothetical protein